MTATAAIGNQDDVAAAVPVDGKTITLPELTAGAELGPPEVTAGALAISWYKLLLYATTAVSSFSSTHAALHCDELFLMIGCTVDV